MSAASVLTAPDTFEEFLANEQAKDLLRLTTAGSVDDGKSTLIGRLLYDSRSVYDDQLESVTKASAGRNAGTIDFSLLTDGLRAEREQGITIDVAYRYFATPKRKFIIADTPGHEQYTRNMVTGASTAELAIVLVDARKGLLPQSRRHAYISWLLGLRHLVFAVNKMDLVGYSEEVFRQIEADFRKFLASFGAIEAQFVPISALIGDNVVTRGTQMPWYSGPSLLEHLETVPVGADLAEKPFRFAVQRVVRPNLDFRGYAGTIASGRVRSGDEVVVLPSGRRTRVAQLVTFDGDLTEAQAGQSVTLTLEDEVDVSRGDTFAHVDEMPEVAPSLEATIVWLNEMGSETGKRYRLKQGTNQQWADLSALEYRTNINTLDQEPAGSLEMNAIGVVRIDTARPLVFDRYEQNRATGSFILIDPASNATVAAGMIRGKAELHKRNAPVSLAERVTRQRHQGAVVNLGGREDIAWQLERLLFDHGCTVYQTKSESAEVTDALVRLGALVISVGEPGSQAAVILSGAVYELPTGSNSLEIREFLETLGVLTSDSSWADRGGI